MSLLPVHSDASSEVDYGTVPGPDRASLLVSPRSDSSGNEEEYAGASAAGGACGGVWSADWSMEKVGRGPINGERHSPKDFVGRNDGGEGKSLTAFAVIGGYSAALFNTVNSIVGAGILGFPYAFSWTGLTTGLIFTVLVSTVCFFTIYIVVVASQQTKARGYQDIMGKLFPKSRFQWPKVVTQFILVLYLEGACVVYLTVVYQSLQPVLVAFCEPGVDRWYKNKYFLIFITAALIEWPLSLLKKTEFLAPTSIISVGGGVYLVVFVLIYFCSTGYHEMPASVQKSGAFDFYGFNTGTLFGWFPGAILAFPTIFFAFQCHACLVPVFSEFQKRFPSRSVCRMMGVVAVGFVGVVVLYLIIGCLGFFVFGSSTADNILNNFDARYLGANLGRAAIGVTACLTYPLQNFAARQVIASVSKRVCGKKIWKEEKGEDMPNWFFYAVACAQFGINVVLACVLPALSDAFDIIGAVACSSLMFIFPGLMAWKMKWRHTALRWAIAIGLVGIGLFAMVSAGTGTIVKIVRDALPLPSS